MANKIGRCHICGKEGKLSFEHIPPKSMGNKQSIKSYKGVDIIENAKCFDASAVDGVRYAKMRRGAGVHTLCTECNNYLGSNYVKEFAGYIKELGAIFIQGDLADDAKTIHLERGNVNILAFFKHVISNFCATTPCDTMADCRNFLLDKESNNFPSRYRLYMFAVPNPESGMITTGWMSAITNEGLYTFAHVAMFPAGFTLLNVAASNFVPQHLGCEITPMAKQKWGNCQKLILELPFMSLDRMLPVPISPSF